MTHTNLARVIPFPRPPSSAPFTPKDQEHSLLFGKGLTESTVVELITMFANPSTERTYRDRALLFVALRTALRAHELISLRWSQSIETPEGETLFRFTGKGSRIRYALPGPKALNYIREYHKAYPGVSDHLFLSLPDRRFRNQRHPLTTRGLQKIIASWQKQTCSGRTIHPHALRHTAVQRAMDLGGSLVAQKLAGHSSPVTTSKFYTRPYVNATSFLQWPNPEPTPPDSPIAKLV